MFFRRHENTVTYLPAALDAHLFCFLFCAAVHILAKTDLLTIMGCPELTFPVWRRLKQASVCVKWAGEEMRRRGSRTEAQSGEGWRKHGVDEVAGHAGLGGTEEDFD